jgi:hypothetical protein
MAGSESEALQQALQYEASATRRPIMLIGVCLFVSLFVYTSYATKHLDGTTSYRLSVGRCTGWWWSRALGSSLEVLEQVTALMSVSLASSSKLYRSGVRHTQSTHHFPLPIQVLKEVP